jgi:hypothetical protein
MMRKAKQYSNLKLKYLGFKGLFLGYKPFLLLQLFTFMSIDLEVLIDG